MTALQLNAELYRAMSEIADNEKLLAKVLAYVKGLAWIMGSVLLIIFQIK